MRLASGADRVNKIYSAVLVLSALIGFKLKSSQSERFKN